MRLPLAFALLAVASAGCVVTAKDDPFAYLREPLYSGGFDLTASSVAESQAFRVEDGSIAEVRVEVFVNLTQGRALVELVDPSGATVLSVAESVERGFPLRLGVWTVTVTPESAQGHVGILATRR